MSTIELSPYLHFNGNCQEALEFYESVFGGELTISRFSDFPSPDGSEIPSDYQDKVMHSTLAGEHVTFMASDAPPGMQGTVGDNVSLSLAGTDQAVLTKYFEGLSAGGTVTVPLSKQVWGDTFGMLTDKFGVHWMVNISAAPQKAM